MALPEDDVEEIDPEPALARILDHEHDAIVVGPGPAAGPRDGRAGPLAARRRGRGRRAPIVLDAEALRSMATMDGWWEGDRRPAVLTPHAGEFARLRAGSGDRAAGRRRPRRRRRRAPGGRPRRGRDLALGRRPQGRPDDHRGARRGRRDRAVREPGARDRRDRRRPGRARSARSSPRASTPFAAARLGVYLHGLAGDVGPRAVRRRGSARVGPARRPRDGPQAPRRGGRAADRQQAARVRGTGRARAAGDAGRRTGRRAPAAPTLSVARPR